MIPNSTPSPANASAASFANFAFFAAAPSVSSRLFVETMGEPNVVPPMVSPCAPWPSLPSTYTRMSGVNGTPFSTPSNFVVLSCEGTCGYWIFTPPKSSDIGTTPSIVRTSFS